MTHWFKAALNERDAQLAEYCALRAASPGLFGNSCDGCWDGTPETGPQCCLAYDPAADTRDDCRWWLLWRVYKHAWPLDYIYCIGRASDSRGERTQLLLTLDVRTLPKRYVGRYKLDLGARRDFKPHRVVISRALADGYDLHAHARQIEEEAQAQHKARVALIETRIAANQCRTCGNRPIVFQDTGECDLCDEIPF